MAKFVIVDKVPENLEKDCVVIKAPNFAEEIKACDGRKPKTKVLSPNYMRSVIQEIALRYAGEDFSPITSVKVNKFKGVPCETEQQVEEAMLKLFQADYPKMFDLYVDYHIKNRPYGTKLIYFLGDFKHSSMFFEHGIDQLKTKDVGVYLGKDSKKIVGKPAITAKESTKKSDNMV